MPIIYRNCRNLARWLLEGRDAPDQRAGGLRPLPVAPAEAGTLRTQLLLDEGVGKSLFCLLVGDALAIPGEGHS